MSIFGGADVKYNVFVQLKLATRKRPQRRPCKSRLTKCGQLQVDHSNWITARHTGDPQSWCCGSTPADRSADHK